MKIAIIGRTETLYKTISILLKAGHEICALITAKEAPEYKKTARDFEEIAQDLNIPYASTARIHTVADILEGCGAEIGISMNYTGIIPQNIIDLFPQGILNAHGGDLPRYRGNACQAWAIINGEDKIGLCIHKMIGSELDSGDIIMREYLPLDLQTTITQVYEWFDGRIPELFVSAVSKLAADPNFILERQSTASKDILRCYPRKPEDGRINWSITAEEIIRLINASNKPYAGAFAKYSGQKLIVWAAELVNDHECFCAIPGQVTLVGKEYVEVACGKGKIKLLQVQIDDVVGPPSNWITSIRDRLS
ncbi:methionyl-tRNA formyltransferase [Terasakiella sp.]|uniref:methionyl-tRNA formyltransferase n=1 Tax=Terasakiella sp. TaxID=2034861 RepID=UPI003AA7E840